MTARTGPGNQHPRAAEPPWAYLSRGGDAVRRSVGHGGRRTNRSEATPVVRNVLGSLIALIGATAAVWSPFRPWYDGRHGAMSGSRTSSAASAARARHSSARLLPMAFAALVTLIGVALRSRALLVIAGLVVLGFTILWMVRQGQAAGELTAGVGRPGHGRRHRARRRRTAVARRADDARARPTGPPARIRRAPVRRRTLRPRRAGRTTTTSGAPSPAHADPRDASRRH